MAFIDTYTFQASAGRGGDGVVRWRREKFIPKGGPNGGNGGRGGDFYVRAVRDITRLGKLIHTDKHHAQDGQAGGSSSCTGANGERYVLELPVGSVITREGSESVLELLRDGEEVLLLRGGDGGFGNEHYKSSTNQQPMQCTKGKEGDSAVCTVELRIMADVGLIGLPNAGKTSLLNALTNAGAKVGDYPFTTLDPNLGVYFGYVLADIPGLIEGASEGKGLGHKFLRHISRTRLLLHIISSERDNIVNDYNVVCKELASHDDLLHKQQLVVFSKTDMCNEVELRARVKDFEQATGVTVFATVSVLDDVSLKYFGDSIIQHLSANHA